MIEIVDNEIIKNFSNLFKNKDNIFSINEEIDSIKGYIFYLENNNIINYKKIEFDINNNILSKKKLMSIIMEYNKLHNKKFDLTGIYKFEPILKNDEFEYFYNNTNKYNFITEYDKLQDIKFNPNIELLNDNNCIILLFSRKTKKEDQKKNKTKKKVKFLLDTNVIKKEKPNKTKKMI